MSQYSPSLCSVWNIQNNLLECVLPYNILFPGTLATFLELASAFRVRVFRGWIQAAREQHCSQNGPGYRHPFLLRGFLPTHTLTLSVSRSLSSSSCAEQITEPSHRSSPFREVWSWCEIFPVTSHEREFGACTFRPVRLSPRVVIVVSRLPWELVERGFLFFVAFRSAVLLCRK